MAFVRQWESAYYQTRMTVEWYLTDARNDVTGETPTHLIPNWPSIENQRPVPPVARPVRPVGQKQKLPASSACHSPACGTKTTNNGKAGVWVRVFEELAARPPDSMQFIGSSIIRAHQYAATVKRGRITPSAVLLET